MNWEPPCIVVYVEIWFDVDAKFGTNTSAADAWVDLYAMYNPAENYLYMEYYCDAEKSEDFRKKIASAVTRRIIELVNN